MSGNSSNPSRQSRRPQRKPSLTSEYSVATNFAIDRLDRTNPRRSPAPPVPALPRIIGYEPGTTIPIYDTPGNNAQAELRRARQESQQAHYDEAAAKLEGIWRDTRPWRELVPLADIDVPLANLNGRPLTPPAIQSASSSPKSSQRPGLFRALSNRAKNSLKKTATRALRYADEMGEIIVEGPKGGPLVQAADERRRQAKAEKARAQQPVISAPRPVSPNASLGTPRTVPAPTPAPRPQAPRNPQAPRPVKKIGHPNRMTTFGDFIDYESPESSSDGDSDTNRAPIDLSTYQAPPPPPPPTADPAPSNSKRRGDQSKPAPNPPTAAPQDEVTNALRENLYSPNPSSSNGELSGRQFGQMPTWADEAFSNPDSSIISQVDAMSLSDSEKLAVATEGQRLRRRMIDQPPPGATGVEYEDMEPSTVVDTTVHEGHTSWRVTDFPAADVIQSYYKRVPAGEERLSRDPAAELMQRLEDERAGKVGSRRGGSSRGK